MSLIDDIKRDREVGTPGAWMIYKKSQPMSIRCAIHQVTNFGIEKFPAAFVPAWEGDGSDDPTAAPEEALSNARRIARVPDLEQAYLDLREKAYALADASETLGYHWDELLNNIDSGEEYDARQSLKIALAAYREATS